jgi:DNA-binding CsgD family transcriptional regulator
MYKKMIRIHNIDDLAIREKEVFLLLAKGQRTSEIAMQLGIKANTVSTIKKIVLKKLNINNSLELFQYAIKQKINKP